MLIYLDSMIVQYCADFEDFIFSVSDKCPVNEPKLRKEIFALRTLVEWEQLGDWTFAASPQLISELYSGRLKQNQRRVYKILLDAWKDSDWREEFPLVKSEVDAIERSLSKLSLKGAKDQRHLAEAIALNSSWFLTNDKELIEKCKKATLPIHVVRPSESLPEISIGLFLK